MSDSAPLVPAKLAADQDIARIHNDGNAWSWNHLATVVAGDDPALALANFMAEYWNRQNQYMLISPSKAFSRAASMAGNLLAIHSESVAAQTAATRLNGATFVDATQRLGDRGDRLVAVAMHSATEAALRKLDLIDFIPDSQGETQIRTFQGRRVIVDDGCPSRAGTTDGLVYTTYLFGAGAFGMGFADLEWCACRGRSRHGRLRDGAGRAEQRHQFLVNRRRFILHPRGVKFTSASVAGANPTNAELETAANWVRVWENKNVPRRRRHSQHLNQRRAGVRAGTPLLPNKFMGKLLPRSFERIRSGEQILSPTTFTNVAAAVAAGVTAAKFPRRIIYLSAGGTGSVPCLAISDGRQVDDAARKLCRTHSDRRRRRW